MAKGDELLACPMCGGTDSDDNAIQEAKLYLHHLNGPLGRYYRVVCNCGVEGPPGKLHTDAITAWNTRSQK